MRRSRSYWLLARLFKEQPEPALLEDMFRGLLESEARSTDPGLRLMSTAVARALASASDLTALQVEYTRLLGGFSRAGGAPEPYEAMAREGSLFGESTEAVAAAYVAAGYPELATEYGPPDHVSNELRFMSLLCYAEMNAWAEGDESAAAESLAVQLSFLDQHLLQWVPQWCERLSQCTAHPFYLAIAGQAAQACVNDRQDVVQLLHAPA